MREQEIHLDAYAAAISKSDSSHPLSTKRLHFDEPSYRPVRRCNEDRNVKTKAFKKNEFLTARVQDITHNSHNRALKPFLGIDVFRFWYAHMRWRSHRAAWWDYPRH